MYRKEPWEWAIVGGFALLSLALFALVAFSFLKQEWQLELVRSIAAPPAAVFAAVAESDRRIAWEPNLLDLAPLMGEPRERGATRLLFMSEDGRRWQEEEEQLAFDRPALWSVRRDGPDAERRIAVRLEPTADGDTRLRWRETVRYKGLEGRILALVTLRGRRASLERALPQLAMIAAKSPQREP